MGRYDREKGEEHEKGRGRERCGDKDVGGGKWRGAYNIELSNYHTNPLKILLISATTVRRKNVVSNNQRKSIQERAAILTNNFNR